MVLLERLVDVMRVEGHRLERLLDVDERVINGRRLLSAQLLELVLDVETVQDLLDDVQVVYLICFLYVRVRKCRNTRRSGQMCAMRMALTS